MQEPSPTNGFQTAHAELLISSFQKVTGRSLLSEATSKSLYDCPDVVLSHNANADPILTYGNLAAQSLWQLSWDQLTQLPSRKTAEPAHQAQRTEMFQHMRKYGFYENYRGIRISATGQRFEIRNATIWTLTDAFGHHIGEAATFKDYSYL